MRNCTIPVAKNKGADQMCSYCTADLHLCFRIDKNPVFSLCSSSNIKNSDRILLIFMVKFYHKLYIIILSYNIFLKSLFLELHR